jgi:micrococcal nuclease
VKSSRFLPRSLRESFPRSLERDDHALAIRGGNEHDTPNGDGSSQLAPQLIAGPVTLAPVRLALTSLASLLGLLAQQVKSLSFSQCLLVVTAFLLGFWTGRLRPFWKQYTDINDVPSSLFGEKAPSLRGRAVAISDGDTIRFLHQPTRFHPGQLKKGGKKTSEVALPIRLCTIDAPETAKFGKPGQPFGKEAKEYLQSLLDNKVVRIRLLQKDHYGRGVAEVFITSCRFPFFFFRRKYVDSQMLREGLAEVYTGVGAVYGILGKDEYLSMQEKARKAKKGIWSQKNRESAADYKKRTR